MWPTSLGMLGPIQIPIQRSGGGAQAGEEDSQSVCIWYVLGTPWDQSRPLMLKPLDLPIKHFAQRHTNLDTDTIAPRDLGASMARQTKPGGTSALLSQASTYTKRAPWPEPRKRNEPSWSNADYGPAPKQP